MRIAIIENGAVARVVTGGDDWQDVFEGVTGVPSDTANVGDMWDGSAFSAPPLPPPTITELNNYASAKRWQVEIGGVSVAGTPVRTDEKSQAKITGAIQLLAADPTIASIDWEAQPGIWEALDAETMKTIGIAVGRHVQACFTCLKAVQEEITAGTITTFEQIDAAGWPSNA